MNATFQNVSLKSEKTQLDLVCIYVSPKTSSAAEEIICCTHANFLKTPRNTNQLSFLANVWESQFLYCKMNNCESHNDNTTEEHTSVKRALHYFHSCRLHPFYILGSASCSTGSCSFRFNNVGHVINSYQCSKNYLLFAVS